MGGGRAQSRRRRWLLPQGAPPPPPQASRRGPCNSPGRGAPRPQTAASPRSPAAHSRPPPAAPLSTPPKHALLTYGGERSAAAPEGRQRRVQPRVGRSRSRRRRRRRPAIASGSTGGGRRHKSGRTGQPRTPPFLLHRPIQHHAVGSGSGGAPSPPQQHLLRRTSPPPSLPAPRRPPTGPGRATPPQTLARWSRCGWRVRRRPPLGRQLSGKKQVARGGRCVNGGGQILYHAQPRCPPLLVSVCVQSSK